MNTPTPPAARRPKVHRMRVRRYQTVDVLHAITPFCFAIGATVMLMIAGHQVDHREYGIAVALIVCAWACIVIAVREKSKRLSMENRRLRWGLSEIRAGIRKDGCVWLEKNTPGQRERGPGLHQFISDILR